jgi:GNAT superfamily N-acetyltransferase
VIDQLRHPDQAADIYRALATQAEKNPSKITSAFLEEAGPLLIHRAATFHVVRDASSHPTVNLGQVTIAVVHPVKIIRPRRTEVFSPQHRHLVKDRLVHAAETTDAIARSRLACAARLIWFEDTHESARTRLMLKTFGDQDSGHRGPAMRLSDCPCASTFAAFADEIGPEGFTFLHQRMEAGIDDGPVLVTVEDDRVVGAIGPLATMTDAAGVVTQPPQYFAVHPGYRGRGHGRALWRASMAWGKANGAQHKILQASAGTAAEGLYLSEGLVTLGFTHTADLPS